MPTTTADALTDHQYGAIYDALMSQGDPQLARKIHTIRYARRAELTESVLSALSRDAEYVRVDEMVTEIRQVFPSATDVAYLGMDTWRTFVKRYERQAA